MSAADLAAIGIITVMVSPAAAVACMTVVGIWRRWAVLPSCQCGQLVLSGPVVLAGMAHSRELCQPAAEAIR